MSVPRGPTEKTDDRKLSFLSSVFSGDLPVQVIGALTAGVCGAAYALGLARFLYQSQPALAALGDWPATLSLALVGGLAAGVLHGFLAARLGKREPTGTEASGLRAERLAGAFLPALVPLLDVLLPDVNLLREKVLLGGGAALTLALLVRAAAPRAFSRLRPAGALLPALIVLALYLRTLAPTVGEADTFEFQVDIARLAVAHPTGYPLFILLGKLFTWLPVGGTLAFRANLASAAFGALAALASYLLARRLGAGRPAAALTSLLAGVSPTLWSRSVEAEVYSLHALLVVGLLILMVKLQRCHVSRVTCHVRTVHLLAFLFGLSLTNHLTSVLLVPALILSVLIAGPRLRPTQWIGAGLLLLLGFSVYLYLPLRWPAVNGGERMTLAMFVDYLTGAEPQGALRLDAFLSDGSRYAILGRRITGEFGAVGAGLAVAGLAYLAWQNRRGAAITLLAYLGLLWFPLSFYVPDPDYSAFFIAPYLIQALWIGMGFQAALHLIGSTQPVLRSALAGAVFLLPLSLLWTTLPRVDKSEDWLKYEQGQVTLQQPLEQGALVLADSERFPPLFYLQVVEGVRPDLDIRVLPDEAAYRQALEEGLARGQTVYLGRYLPGLAGAFHLRSVGPLVEVRTESFESLPVAQPIGAVYGDQISLLGHSGLRASAPPGDSLPVTLIWRADSPPDGNFLVRLRLLPAKEGAAPAWTSPPRIPAGAMYPTTAWTEGEIVPDFHWVNVPSTALPGDYFLQAGLFPPFSEEGLLVSGEPWVTVGHIRVTAAGRLPAPGTASHIRWTNGLILVGWDAPETASRGVEIPLALYWRATQSLAQTATVQIAHQPEGGALSLLQEYPVAAWPEAGQAAVSLPIFMDLEDETVQLRIAMPPERVRCAWLQLLTESCPLASIRLAGTADRGQAVNFADRILLTEYSLLTEMVSPGGQVRVSVEWQALQTLYEDYTVFVHLLGPDGQVHGQIDTWPGQGTQPTSGWQPGRVIRDTYEIVVPADAPRGEYSIEIGWYLLATLDRLPVLGADGLPVDDRWLRGGLRVE